MIRISALGNLTLVSALAAVLVLAACGGAQPVRAPQPAQPSAARAPLPAPQPGAPPFSAQYFVGYWTFKECAVQQFTVYDDGRMVNQYQDDKKQWVSTWTTYEVAGDLLTLRWRDGVFEITQTTQMRPMDQQSLVARLNEISVRNLENNRTTSTPMNIEDRTWRRCAR